MKNLGGYDEKYGIYEDTPFYTKMLKAGYKIYGLNKDVQKYRTSDTNIFANTAYLFNYQHKLMNFQYQKDLCFPYFKIIERIRRRLYFGVYYIMNMLGLRRRTIFNRFIQVSLLFLFAFITLDIPLIKKMVNRALRMIVPKSHPMAKLIKDEVK